MTDREAIAAEYQARKRVLRRTGFLWSIPLLVAVAIGTTISYTIGDITNESPRSMWILGIALFVAAGASWLRAQRVIEKSFRCPNCGQPPGELQFHELLIPWSLSRKIDVPSCQVCAVPLR
jgi:hypothetical protein